MFVKRTNNLHKRIVGLMAIAAILMISGAAIATTEPGTAGIKSQKSYISALSAGNSIKPVVSETGKISLSVDGLGTNNNIGIIQVEKPAGATVRKAYMAAASTGFSSHQIANGDITIDGSGINWDISISNGIGSYNYWADVTSIVKSKIDAAPAGRVDFNITEVNKYSIDGEILTVIFDDPNQLIDNTIVLLFGAQNPTGDTFAIALANPIDKTDPNLALDMSLGISYGYQVPNYGDQFSIVDVNGKRLTSSAGGQDDGADENGALIAVGGLDDSNANPGPFDGAGCSTAPRCDDELYSLLPFVNNSDTSITVNTKNPSNNDNIFFAALNLKSTTAIVGEGILLTPLNATNPVGTQHTVIATVQDDKGKPIENRDVNFTIVSGPNAGKTGTAKTNASGQAEFTYTGNSAGTDVIEASFVNSQGATITSNSVTKDWVSPPPPPVPELSTMVLMSAGILGLIGLARLKRD